MIEFDSEITLEEVIDDPSKLEQAFEQAAQKQEQRLWGDPEWTEPRFTILKDIVKAFLVGIVEADAWFAGYSLPPNIESVGNALCGAVAEQFKGHPIEEGADVSLLDLQAFYREFIDATPLCREWNDFPGSGFVTRYDATPKERTFIDLGALVQNACRYIRDDRRAFDKFNAEFEAKYATETTNE